MKNNRLNDVNKQKIRTAAQTAVLMAILTLGSKLLGFIREMVMAGFFGTSYITDAYVMSQAIPSVIFAGVFGAVAVAYMPLFSKETEQKSTEAGYRFTSEVINILIIASVFSIVVGLMFAQPIVRIFASGFTGETAKLTVYFLRVTFAYILFTSITGILEAFLQYKNIFLPQIFTGYLQNVVVIITIAISSYYNNYYLLAYGLLIGYFIRFIILIFLSKRIGLKYKATFSLNTTAKKIIMMSLPIFFGSSVIQINMFVDKTLASNLNEGSVAALNYANLIISLITGLTVTILTTIIYPKMTHANSTNNNERFNEILSIGINLVLIIAIPFSLGAMVFNKEIVKLIYERGAFDQHATSLTSSALFYYAIGMLFMSANTLIVQAYYSKYDTRTPLFAGVIAVIVNIIFNLLLINPMQHNGLALATSISYFCNTIILNLAMRKKYPEITIIKSKKKVFQILLTSVLSVGAAAVFYIIAKSQISGYDMIFLFTAVLIAGVLYLGLLKYCKIDELTLIKSIFLK